MSEPQSAGTSGRSPGQPTLGIAGGGQLAQMMLPAAAALGLRVVVLDPDPQCSSAGQADGVIVGAFDSLAGLRELAARSDFLTFEIERISAAALTELEAEGYLVRPSAAVLHTIQDKLVQKQFLRDHDIPTSAFAGVDTPRDLQRDLPYVWKARRDGYDGRGVAVVRNVDDVAALPDGAAMVEDLIDIDYELAIMIARDSGGRIAHYPLVEIIMDNAAHVMDSLVAPAAVPAAVEAQCLAIAERLVGALDYIGVLAVEYFVDRAGKVYVNELSPRPHNSGHYTIEACVTSQFEQHVRAVAGLELGDPGLRSAAVTFNVLGSGDASGTPRYIGFEQRPAADGIYVHCYDKPQVRPGRKMGHVTVLAATREQALAKAAAIKDTIRVDSADE